MYISFRDLEKLKSRELLNIRDYAIKLLEERALQILPFIKKYNLLYHRSDLNGLEYVDEIRSLSNFDIQITYGGSGIQCFTINFTTDIFDGTDENLNLELQRREIANQEYRKKEEERRVAEAEQYRKELEEQDYQTYLRLKQRFEVRYKNKNGMAGDGAFIDSKGIIDY